MAIPPRISFITLACRDGERMTRFFRDFAWPEALSSDEHHRVFQLSNGVVLALYAAANYEPAYGPVADGFRGFTLAINLGSRDEVVMVREALTGIEGVADLEEVVDSPHGFSGFSFRDPEGNIWDVAWARGTEVRADGSLTWD